MTEHQPFDPARAPDASTESVQAAHPEPAPDASAETDHSPSSDVPQDADHGTSGAEDVASLPLRADHDPEETRDGRDAEGTDVRERRGPVFGTIFWGALLLVIAFIVGIQAVPAVSIDPTVLLIGAVVALGCLLVVAGVAAALRRPRR